MAVVRQGEMKSSLLHLMLLDLLLLASCSPLSSTTVHRVMDSGAVRSHGGFLGGYPFKVSGQTRSFARPDFRARPDFFLKRQDGREETDFILVQKPRELVVGPGRFLVERREAEENQDPLQELQEVEETGELKKEQEDYSDYYEGSGSGDVDSFPYQQVI